MSSRLFRYYANESFDEGETLGIDPIRCRKEREGQLEEYR